MNPPDEIAAPKAKSGAADEPNEAFQSNRDIQSRGWFRAFRSDEACHLISKNLNAFVLLYIIAYRAQRTDSFNPHDCKPGEAFIGDHKVCGMSEQNYRTAKMILEKSRFATFRPTNRGTIAKLMDTRLFDINIAISNGQINSQPTDSQRTANGQPTTTNNEKNDKKGKGRPQFWQLNRDKETFEAALNKERERTTPDKELIAAYRRQIASITAEMKANGQ